jgi:gas vesicle protein
MAQTEDFVTRDSDLASGRGRDSREIRSEIDRTRSDMDETFAALDAKLTPKEIGLELWSLFKGGSTTGASKLWQVAREHPMPAAVVGLGLGWLMVESSRKSETGYDGRDRGNYRGYGNSSYRQGYAGTGSYSGYDSDLDSGVLTAAKDKVQDLTGSAKDALSSAGDKVSDLAGQAKDQVSGLGHQVADKASTLGHQVADRASSLGHQVSDRASDLRRQAKTGVRRARVGFWQTMEENPLMVGAATLALGVIAGLLIPSTDREDELMGETRDHLLDQAKEAGQQVLDKSKHVAEAVADKVKEEARNQGLTPEGVADKVKNVAKEATNTAKEEAQRQNLTPDALLSNQQGGQQGQQAQPQGQSQQPKPAPQGQGQQQQAKPAQPSQQAAGQPQAQGSKTPSAKPEVNEPELAKR